MCTSSVLDHYKISLLQAPSNQHYILEYKYLHRKCQICCRWWKYLSCFCEAGKEIHFIGVSLDLGAAYMHNCILHLVSMVTGLCYLFVLLTQILIQWCIDLTLLIYEEHLALHQHQTWLYYALCCNVNLYSLVCFYIR